MFTLIDLWNNKPSTVPVLAALLVGWVILYPLALAIYRLTIHPLAKFPGPKIAAATFWYEFYYDWWCQGKYVYEIEKMHKLYGPIVRLNPEEISINDSTFYNEIYVTESKRRTEHYDNWCKGMGFDDSHIMTVDHDLHRRRRKPLEPYFSRLGITRLESKIVDTAKILIQRLEGLKGSGIIVHLDHCFAAFSGDVIGRICSEDREKFLLDEPNFAIEWYNIFLRSLPTSIPLVAAFPALVQMASKIPESIVLYLLPAARSYENLKQVALKEIKKAKQEQLKQSFKLEEREAAMSLFGHIVNSDMPESERSDERLAKEAQVILGAGTATSARALCFITYFLLANKSYRVKLEEELRGLTSDNSDLIPTWAELERLPFFQALVKETLRLGCIEMHRQPRCFPDTAITYREWTIPIGTPIGMSSYFMHMDPVVYPNPFEFIPDRWLQDVTPAMNRNYVPFSRGSRNCLGQNLAYAEIYILTALLFRPNGPKLELFETDETDVRYAHDYIIALPKLDSKGVRVTVH